MTIYVLNWDDDLTSWQLMIWHHDSNFSLQDWASAKWWEETKWNEKESKMKIEMKWELMWMHFNVMKHRWN